MKKIPYTILNKSDLWSLGKLMMFCLKSTNEKNINKNSGNDTLEKILNTRLYWAIQKS